MIRACSTRLAISSAIRSPTGCTHRALDVLAHLRSLGPTVVLTDGDAVFQPHKVVQAGIAKAVAGNVLVYIHKELSLDDVERRYPADRYVLVDDKLRILTAAKAFWGERVTTVLPLQGQFATDPEIAAAHPAADVTSTTSEISSASTCRASSGSAARDHRGRTGEPLGQSSTQRRKPPRNASSLWPSRQFGGSSPSSRALPPPSTT